MHAQTHLDRDYLGLLLGRNEHHFRNFDSDVLGLRLRQWTQTPVTGDGHARRHRRLAG